MGPRPSALATVALILSLRVSIASPGALPAAAAILSPRVPIARQDFAAPVPDCPSGDCKALAVALQAWTKAEAAAVEAAAPAASAAAARHYAAKLTAWGEKARPTAELPHGKVPSIATACRPPCMR